MSEFTLLAKVLVVLCWASAIIAPIYVYKQAPYDKWSLAAIAAIVAPVAILFAGLALHLICQIVYGSWYVLTH